MSLTEKPGKLWLFAHRIGKGMRSRWFIVGIVGVAVGAAASQSGRVVQQLGKLTASKPKPPRYERVERGTVEVSVTETGTIEPLKKVELKSKVAGRIAELFAEEGDRVKAGQLLAVIDPTEINSQVEQIRAQLDGARARYEQARRAVTFQVEQTRTGITQNEQVVKAAEARLTAAEEQSRSEPKLSSSQIDQARASLQAAEARVSLLKNSTHPQALVQARSDSEEAQTRERVALRNLERQRQLHAQGYASRQDVDAVAGDVAAARSRAQQAKSRMEVIVEQNRLELADAQSRVAEAQAALDRAVAGQSQVAVRAAEVESARASVDQARAQLEAARANEEQDRMRRDEVAAARAAVKQIEQQLREVAVRQFDTKLIASMDGVVSKKYIEKGELVTSGVSTFSSGTPVLQIADLSVMLVRMTVNEVDVEKVHVGQPVEIRIDGARGTVFQGHVMQVAPASVNSAQAGGDSSGAQSGAGGGTGSGGVVRFAVKIQVDRPDARLMPGMSARCTIIIDRRKDVLRLPVSCVSGKGAEATARVVDEKLVKGEKQYSDHSVSVRVGLRGDSHVEIVSGLKVGDRVQPSPYTGPARKGINLNAEVGD